MNFEKIFSIKIINYSFTIYLLGIRIRISIKSLKEKFFAEENLKLTSKLLNFVSSPSQLPKATGELRESQLKELEILKIINKLSKEYHLIYWIDGGTLLGAVRHKGYIPWDSDTDICMPRDDYNKIIPLLKKAFDNTDIQVREYYRCKSVKKINYQICLCNKHGEKKYGVDIFPIDYYHKSDLNDDERYEITKQIKLCSKTIQKKALSNEEFLKNVNKVRTLAQELQKKYILKNNSKNPQNGALYTGTEYGWIAPKYFVWNYNKIFPLKEIEFEGEIFNCPNDIKDYLVNYYGKNYMEYPPKFKINGDKIEEYIDNLKIIKSEE